MITSIDILATNHDKNRRPSSIFRKADLFWLFFRFLASPIDLLIGLA